MTASKTPIKATGELTLFDLLSRLTIEQAERLLGPDGKRLIIEGGKVNVDPEIHTSLNAREYWFRDPGRMADVRVTLDPTRKSKLLVSCTCTDCSADNRHCESKGAALSFLLEEKYTLGLSEEPGEYAAFERLDDEELCRRALAEREERATLEKMRCRSLDTSTPWTDYLVSNAVSGKTYRVALRGFGQGESFCNCPDFRTNTLGTCKHIINVTRKVRRKFPAKVLARKWEPDQVFVSLAYGKDLKLRLEAPTKIDSKADRLIRPFRGKLIDGPLQVKKLLRVIENLESLDHPVTVYPDAEEFINRMLHRHRIAARMEKVREEKETHPLREKLLKARLLPYQLDGIAFAAGRGRAILADDMGLGKTIQGIGVAEMLRREAGISRVLVVCPASLKGQWAAEIAKFSDLSCQVVLGAAKDRPAQYADRDSFFTVCNYEQVLRDIISIESVPWDFIILDEGQRIKNWEAKTSKVIKTLKSPYALVLSGTPLENRIDDLFSVIEFIDDRRLGPAFRFFQKHRVTTEHGKVLGYKNLDQLREALSPIMLRRTRQSVLEELPPRTTEIVRIPPTQEQQGINDDRLRSIGMILNKKFLTEMDLLRVRKMLLAARMSADSTFLVDKKEPGYSSKLERLEELLWQLSKEEDRKMVLFSEWTTMLDLIEALLGRLGLDFVRLDGSVPQKKRQQLVSNFQNNPDCRLIIMTNAGATGLNLQAANTVINVDLPWNPAILEQRIGRAHRMGQKRAVQVYILVTEKTVEEEMLNTLSVKHELARAALDPDSDINEIDLVNGIDDLRHRLERLLGAECEAPVDESEKLRTEREVTERSREKKERVAEAGGQMLTAAFSFLNELIPESDNQPDPASKPPTFDFFRESLGDCIDAKTGDDGKPRLTLTLPDEGALDQLATTLARIAEMGKR